MKLKNLTNSLISTNQLKKKNPTWATSTIQEGPLFSPSLNNQNAEKM